MTLDDAIAKLTRTRLYDIGLISTGKRGENTAINQDWFNDGNPPAGSKRLIPIQKIQWSI